MCGIAGEIRFDGAPVDRDAVRAMQLALAHRGPDDQDVYCDGPIGLAHRRLSIIDLSAAGHQPMWSHDRAMSLVFNGEIYNYQDVRRELESAGDRFVSGSDTEVVLAAIQRWGIADAVGRFIGMFAFAVWDTRERALYLCRDRVGVKPLYYYADDRHLLFGSELKALMARPDFPRTLDPRGVSQFFVAGYLVGGTSIFQKTKQLGPGQFLRVDATGRAETHTYWSLDAVHRGTFKGSFVEALDAWEELAESAFGYRLVSDVPVGVFLSGGVDSSYLAAVLAKRRNADLLHITIGFRDPAFDESAVAAAVAKDLGVRHVVAYMSAEEAQAELANFAEVFDEPFGDTSGLPTMVLSRLARQHVKVALSADGGDEQFFGYESYVDFPNRADRIRAWPLGMRQAASSVMRRALPYRSVLSALSASPAMERRQLINKWERGGRLLGVRNSGDVVRIMNEKGWSAGDLEDLLVRPDTSALSDTVLDPSITAWDRDVLADTMMRADFSAFLGNDVLVKTDRASMAASLECRDPFLDHRIAEFAFSLPLEYLYDGHEHKHIVRRALSKWVRPEVINLPKRGFRIPLYAWLRGPWRPLVEDYLSPAALARVGVLKPAAARAEVDRFYRYRGGRPERLMGMLIFQMWATRWDVSGVSAEAVA